jgi:hypothetical protein
LGEDICFSACLSHAQLHGWAARINSCGALAGRPAPNSQVPAVACQCCMALYHTQLHAVDGCHPQLHSCAQGASCPSCRGVVPQQHSKQHTGGAVRACIQSQGDRVSELPAPRAARRPCTRRGWCGGGPPPPPPAPATPAPCRPPGPGSPCPWSRPAPGQPHVDVR